ncbi:membrane-binding protein [Chryseobacterium sp. Mn2064]|uniref:membrane-binding protein n=1 Tax=Chryseobacterium sp. Mn2064 TaxID=3395263 RepID=UPI003BC49799
MKKLFTSALLALVISINVYSQEKTYFDENWEKTTQDKMEYYRETSPKGKLTLIKDFYKDGALQMEGLASDTTPNNEVFDGKVVWYTPDGKVMSFVTYSKGKQSGPSQTYDTKGRLVEDVVYKSDGTFSGKSFTYKDPESEYFYNSVSDYENSVAVKSTVYDEDIKGIRHETLTNKAGQYETKFYGDKGKYLGSASSGSGESTQVDYHPNPMRIAKIEKYKSDGSIKEGVIYSKNGKLLQEQKRNKKDGYKTTYDQSGKKIGHLVYQYDKESDIYRPTEGEDYQFAYGDELISTIDVYQNGKVTANKVFDENGKLSTETFLKDDVTQEVKYYSEGNLKSVLTYKEGMPYNGIAYEGLNEDQYKDGIVVNTKTYTEEKKLKSEKKLNAKQNGYEGTVYNNKGAVLYTFTQSPNEDGDYSNFTGQIVQYIKGKASNKATVKAGGLQSGKVKLKTVNGVKELERSGKWILLKIYNEEGKLVQDSKVLASTGDDYFSNASQTIILEEDLYNSLD